MSLARPPLGTSQAPTGSQPPARYSDPCPSLFPPSSSCRWSGRPLVRTVNQTQARPCLEPSRDTPGKHQDVPQRRRCAHRPLPRPGLCIVSDQLAKYVWASHRPGCMCSEVCPDLPVQGHLPAQLLCHCPACFLEVTSWMVPLTHTSSCHQSERKPREGSCSSVLREKGVRSRKPRA